MRCIVVFLVGVLTGNILYSAPPDSLDLKIGQMILIGISDVKVTTSSKYLQEIKSGKVGGVLLFEQSISPVLAVPTLEKLTSTLQASSPIPLFISIDQEGGKVNRLRTRYGFPPSVSAKYLGQLNRIDSTKFYADNTAYWLSRLGINLNFAPVLDVDNPACPVLGALHRCYSANTDIIARHAAQVMQSHTYFKINTVTKHFPGHGSALQDSHKGVADVSKTWKKSELAPYIQLIKAGLCNAIMTAHIINTQLDPENLPATLSKRILTGYLRDSLHFEGVIFSDDMQMHAIYKQYGLEESVRLAILAGVDVLMFSNHIIDTKIRTAEQVHAIIKKLVLSGKIPYARIQESYNRILKFKKAVY